MIVLLLVLILAALVLPTMALGATGVVWVGKTIAAACMSVAKAGRGGHE